ncbi:MAG: hypothetical protein II958_03490 [Spirochaetia bacterium]|nr:hypothetical protein [Spirochaetia bacterium]
MRKLFVLILLIFCLASVYAQDSFEHTMGQLSPFYPAQEHSEQAHWIEHFIKSALEKADIPYTETPLDTLKDSHSFAHNISVVLPGTGEQNLVIAVPMAEHSSPVNTALALELAEYFKGREHTSQIQILFLGADFIGSKVASEKMQDEKCTLLYLNFKGISDKIILQTGNLEHITPYWMVNYCNRSLRKSGLSFNLRPEQNILYSMGMIPESSPLDIYLDAGITALMMYNENSTKEQSASIWVSSFCHFVEDFEKQDLTHHDNEDQNYFIMQVGYSYIIMTESYIMIFFLIVTGSILFYIILHTKQAKNYVHLFLKNISIVLWTTMMLFIFFQVSTWISELFLTATRLDTQWQTIIPELISLKVLVGLVLLVFLLPAYSQLKQHNLGNFYSGAAIITALLDMIIFMAIDFSFAAYFTWSLLCIFAFAVVRKRRIKFLCMLLSGLLFIRTIYGILFYPALNLCHDLIFSPMWTNLYLAVFVLPFIFMGIRIFYVIPLKEQLKHRLSKLLGYAALLFLTVLAFRFVYLYRPFSDTNRQLVNAVEFYDLDEMRGTLTLESDYKLGIIQVKTGDEEFNISSKEKRLIYDIQRPQEEVSVWAATSRFLDRKTIEFHVATKGKPDQLYITLKAPSKGDKILILESTYPYQIQNDTVSFFIGKNQPIPFELKVTTHKDSAFDAQIEICYSTMPFDFMFYGEKKYCKPSLILAKKLSFHEEK